MLAEPDFPPERVMKLGSRPSRVTFSATAPAMTFHDPGSIVGGSPGSPEGLGPERIKLFILFTLISFTLLHPLVAYSLATFETFTPEYDKVSHCGRSVRAVRLHPGLALLLNLLIFRGKVFDTSSEHGGTPKKKWGPTTASIARWLVGSIRLWGSNGSKKSNEG